ncbi:MAG: site-specific integrase, partial [Oscillospiraceae bacterium]
GTPLNDKRLSDRLHCLATKAGLPQVVFHSLRHSSIGYKLNLTHGDIKSVQGDSGHAQSKMVTDVYAYILDNNREKTARLFNETFYQAKETINLSDIENIIKNNPVEREKFLEFVRKIQ